jgi:parvulin-like peptidyl-prolyl isomerase
MRKTTLWFVLVGAAAPLLVEAAANPSAGSTNAAAAPPPTAVATLFTNTIVAKGKGISVTRSELDQQLVRTKAALAAQGRSLPPDSAMVERQVLDAIISRDLLLTKITEADKTKGKEQFESSLQRLKTNAKITDEEFNQKLAQQLRLQDMTKQQWEQQNIEQAALPILLERELKIKVGDQQVRKYYDENPARFERPEMVRVAHIVLLTTDPVSSKELSAEQQAAKKKLAETALKRARAGEDFAKLVKEYSEDPDSKEKGGEYTFARGQVGPEFGAATFSLNTNQISDIVTTPYGYHLFKLYEKIPAKMAEFDSVAPDIREMLVGLEIQKDLPAYMQKLRTEADVQILDGRLNSVELPSAVVDPGSGSAPAPEKK